MWFALRSAEAGCGDAGLLVVSICYVHVFCLHVCVRLQQLVVLLEVPLT